jgi:predicted house-cleaning noncanonical NTP pyrophosphatase (MazG superfamily)
VEGYHLSCQSTLTGLSAVAKNNSKTGPVKTTAGKIKTMAKKKYCRKLVRDKIPTLLEEQGKKFKSRKATDKSYLGFLAKKMGEVTRQFKKDPTPLNVAEMHEVMWAIELYMSHTHWEWMPRIAEEKGRYSNQTILEWVEE